VSQTNKKDICIAERILRIGNSPCFDIINTVHSRYDRSQPDYLTSYSDLVKWSAGGNLITKDQRAQLLAAGESKPRSAATAFKRGIELRELLYRLFRAVIQNEQARSRDVLDLNTWVSRVLQRRRVVPNGRTYGWSWDEDPEAFDRPLWEVVAAAVDVLVSGDPKRIKQCPSPDGCGWLFYDVSKNGTRRWCDMRHCGSLSKSRRYYERHKHSV
jgi:predicted RNA-binding Zn ribbon-like protein